MLILFELIAKIVIIIMFGFAMKKMGLIPDAVEQGLSNLLVLAILPLSIVASGNVELSQELATGLKISAWVTAGFYLGSLFIILFICKFLPLDKYEKMIFLTGAIYGNTAFLGFPIMEALYGNEGVLYGVIFNIGYQLTFFTWVAAKMSGEGKMQFKTLIRTPVTIASFTTTFLVLSPFSLPSVIQDSISTVGSMSTPLALILLGTSFVRMRPIELLKDKWCYIINAIRLLIAPIIVLIIMVLLDVETIPAAVMVYMSALPTGSMVAIYAERYNHAPDFAARVVVQSTLLMAITFPIIIALVNAFL